MPLIGTDNIMINSPNIFRELEYTLKIMRAFYKHYISPKEILKMATTNVYLNNSKYDSNSSNSNSNNDLNKNFNDFSIYKKIKQIYN